MSKFITKERDVFPSPKRILNTADRIFEKTDMEILFVGENGKISLYSPENTQEPICSCDNIIDSIYGLLYFHFGIGKPRESYLPKEYINKYWDYIEKGLPEGQDRFSNLETALNNGAKLCFKNDPQQETPKNNVFKVFSPENLDMDMAETVVIKETSFTQGLYQANSLCSIYKYSQQEIVQ